MLSQGVAHFAVAVQLVPEDVGHSHHLGVHKLADGLEGRLIGLDEGIIVLAFPRQGRMHGKLRGDAAEEIRAGLVGKVRNSSVGQHLLDHPGGGGLSVGARDEDRRHVLCQHAQHAGAELQATRPGKSVPPLPSSRSRARQSLQARIESVTRIIIA